VSAPGPYAAAASSFRVADPARALDGRGWDVYLLAVTALFPFVAGLGGTPLAAVDVANVIALGIFAAVVFVHRVRLELPLLLPVLAAATGSVLAVSNAVSLHASVLSMAQDLYLYIWAVALVALLRRRGELLGVRSATAVIALGVAIGALVETWTHGSHSLVSLLSPRGHRSYGSFGNANMLAEFQMLGMFTVLGLDGRLPRALAAAALALMLAGMITAKSNGSLIALAIGLVVWAVCRAHARGIPARRLAGAAALATGVIVVAAWLVSETGAGDRLKAIQKKTVLARLAHSTDVRERIWQRLGHRLAQNPLGIGPGNSATGFVEIGEREREGAMDAKEAHNDYLGYAVERGPLGVIGLFAALVIFGKRLLRGRPALVARMGDAKRGAAVHAAGVGALAALLVQSTVIEQLHFRHLWWFVAWMWAATAPEQVAAGARTRVSPGAPFPNAPDPSGVGAPNGAPA
jgi:O-antigen ligase/polysaccharide polymerase Wzy-like membrane protein